MNKKIKFLIIILLLLLITVSTYLVVRKLLNTDENKTELERNNRIDVVPTMNDEIMSDSSWCGTFQLVWNDMKNELVEQDIVFTPQEEMATNLNKEEFKENMISDEYYFKKFGLMTFEFKEQIEKGIKEKFNQTSDILDAFDWKEETQNDYFFYTMLYRKFEFLQEFSKLEKGEFGNKYSNVEFFGIDKNTEKIVGEQIEVLYYNSKEDFAIIINTKTNDEVIFCKNPKGNTFKDIYDNMNNNTDKYTESKYFKDDDEFKAPNITFNEKREYTELENKWFNTADGEKAIIIKALQTIKFSLNEKGGEIKSEAGIAIQKTSISVDEPRYFYVDDTFAIFLREKGQDFPYFAGRVEDITKFQ